MPLEEEINTVRFTARHSDLSLEESAEGSKSDSSDDSETSQHSDGSEEREEEGDGGDDADEEAGPRKRRKSFDGHSQRQVRAAAIRDGIDGDMDAEHLTPAHGRRRKRRRHEWKWTLGSLDESREDTDGATQ